MTIKIVAMDRTNNINDKANVNNGMEDLAKVLRTMDYIRRENPGCTIYVAKAEPELDDTMRRALKHRAMEDLFELRDMLVRADIADIIEAVAV